LVSACRGNIGGSRSRSTSIKFSLAVMHFLLLCNALDCVLEKLVQWVCYENW
jgi:hypothetical protein